MSDASVSSRDNAPGVKHKGEAKTARIPIKIVAAERLKKPDWIRVRAPSSPRFYEIKKILREHNLHTVCEEASCPNIGECFGKGTATFMIMGDICTRRCPFCDVGHGRPDRIKIVAAERLKKPDWIRVRAPSSPRFYEIKKILREHNLHTVCEEASCPNIGECFGKGTATFMIMGDICTRRCPFCDVGHGRPLPLDSEEPGNLAATIAALKLSYVVITSVDRDDLRDGGAGHFRDCIRKLREISPGTQIEVLVPDFRGRLERALAILGAAPPDVMNHNLETVLRLYKQVRPGSDYAHSLKLLQEFKRRFANIPTKSGLMVGLGETDAEILG